MDKAKFDAVASEYETQHARSIRLSGEDIDYIHQDIKNYDLTFTSCVLHHIFAKIHISLLSQIRDRSPLSAQYSLIAA